MNCAKCSGEIPDEANFCGLCGAPQPGNVSQAETEACAHCGERLPVDARFCGACGTAQQEPGATVSAPRVADDASVSLRVPSIAADGSLDFGFGYPVKVWRALDPECTAAYEVYESQFHQHWADREQVLQYGYFAVSGGRRGLE